MYNLRGSSIDLNSIKDLINTHKEDILYDINRIIHIKSVRDLSSKSANAPFGIGIREVFDEFMEIASEKGLAVRDFNGYAVDVSFGEFDEYVAMLTHLDTVDIFKPSEWNSNPFEVKNDGEFLYARGINDDKAPTIIALYAIYLAKKLKFPLKRSLRLIVGGSEETTWECMEHYFKINKQPVMAFSPDADFPIVNGEKGILTFRYSFDERNLNFNYAVIKSIVPKTTESFVCYELKVAFSTEFYNENKDVISAELLHVDDYAYVNYIGKSSLSRNPHKAINAIDLLVNDLLKIKSFDFEKYESLKFYKDNLLDDFIGKKLGIDNYDTEMGTSSCSTVSFVINSSNGSIKSHMDVDIRYTKSLKVDEIIEILSKKAEFKILRDKKILYTSPNSHLIKSLSSAYEMYTGEKAKLFTKGGASYARVLDNGIAFGPTFEGDNPRPHEPNENIRIQTLWDSLGIYLLSLYNLACLD